MRLRFDRHTFGNLLKNVSPAAAFIPGLGLPVTAALAAAGEAARGKTKLSDLVKAAGSNVAIGGGARAATGLLRSAVQSGGNAGAAGAAAEPTLPIPGVSTIGSAALPATASSIPVSAVTRVPGALSRIASGAGGFIEKHPTAVGMGLQGVGNIATAGAENRKSRAQAALLEQQAGESTYDFERRKARDLAAEPLRRALYGQIGSSLGNSSVAPNPYQTGG